MGEVAVEGWDDRLFAGAVELVWNFGSNLALNVATHPAVILIWTCRLEIGFQDT